MRVIDASAWIDLSLGRASGALRDAMSASGEWFVPEHFRLEAFNAIRGVWLGNKIDDAQFAFHTGELANRAFEVWPTAPLFPRIRELARNASAYDAAYLALAEKLGCPLVTADAKFARVPGIRCRILGVEP